VRLVGLLPLLSSHVISIPGFPGSCPVPALLPTITNNGLKSSLRIYSSGDLKGQTLRLPPIYIITGVFSRGLWKITLTKVQYSML
jgi:hypothetical protein